MTVTLWIVAVLFSFLHLEVQCKDGAKFTNAANCFSVNLMRKLKSQPPDGNLIMSGLSADLALSMLAAGTRGSTADELNQALQNTANGLTNEEVKKESRSTMQRLTSNQDVNLDLANAIYVDRSFPVNQDYKKTLNETFLAKAENVDFKTKAREATEAINSWVSEKTRKLIEKLFDKDLSPSTVLVLLNAIYFKGEWLYKFDAANTKTEPFFNGGDRNAKKMVPLMNQQGEFAYKDDDNFKAQVLRMDYKGEKISFVAVLPHEGVNVDDFEQKMTCQALRDLLDVRSRSQVKVTLPKFDVTSDLDLVRPLRDLGVKKIFDGGDLSGIGPGALVVSEVVQKARIKIYEEGSEAAAVTGIVVIESAAVEPPRVEQFLANRPFYYFIVEKSSGLVLFQGKLNKL